MRCHDVTWRTEGSSRSVPSRGTCGSPAGVGPCCGAPPKALLSAPRGWGEVAAARGRCHSPHVAGRISASAIKHHVGRAWVSSNCFYLHNEAQHGILLVSERGKSKPVPDKQPAPSPTRSSSHPFPRTDGCGVSPAPGSLLPPGSTVPPPALSVGAVTADPPPPSPICPCSTAPGGAPCGQWIPVWFCHHGRTATFSQQRWHPAQPSGPGGRRLSQDEGRRCHASSWGAGGSAPCGFHGTSPVRAQQVSLQPV